ncbi:hypothetical protein [Tabrizicola sp.]|uniref:hypothetical protein n=1 Tax=Tabrizicola sp. TaxID=2005166 RepID=UPI003F375BAF
MMLLTYLSVSLLALTGLSAMILSIAKALADCPEKAPRAKAAGITIATGFLAIGGGAVLLIGALATLKADLSLLVFTMGLACVVLGLGFTQAVTTLRAVVDAGPAAKPLPKSEDLQVQMEPVLA